jgi:hypothetical protein
MKQCRWCYEAMCKRFRNSMFTLCDWAVWVHTLNRKASTWRMRSHTIMTAQLECRSEVFDEGTAQTPYWQLTEDTAVQVFWKSDQMLDESERATTGQILLMARYEKEAGNTMVKTVMPRNTDLPWRNSTYHRVQLQHSSFNTRYIN